MDWHVGARAYVVETVNRRSPHACWVTVTKVGRRWVSFMRDGRKSEMQGDRFDAETLLLDAGNVVSVGRAYLSEQDYIDQTELGQMWTDFVRRLPYSPPGGLTLETLKRVMADLGYAPAARQGGGQ